MKKESKSQLQRDDLFSFGLKRLSAVLAELVDVPLKPSVRRMGGPRVPKTTNIFLYNG